MKYEKYIFKIIENLIDHANEVTSLAVLPNGDLSSGSGAYRVEGNL